jgi:hypothetical protein
VLGALDVAAALRDVARDAAQGGGGDPRRDEDLVVVEVQELALVQRVEASTMMSWDEATSWVSGARVKALKS